MLPVKPFLVSAVLTLAILLNLSSSFIAIKKITEHARGPQYSYHGFDYPETYVSSSPHPVAMVVEETVNFAITSPESMEQWATTQVDGGGFMRLGEARRGFAVSMFHELHCLRLMHFALSGQYTPFARGHMQHCLNYLRQEILCASDVTLEPADILDRDNEMERFGSIHVCKDWEALFRDAEHNWADWVREGRRAEQSDNRN